VLGVNIMAALTDFADLVRTAVKEAIDILFVGAGLPLDLPAFLHCESRTKLAPIVSSGRAAHLLCKKWLKGFQRLPDAFVVEGPKAGGHLGFKPDQIDDPDYGLERLVPEVVEALRPFASDGRLVPVIAAGGVFSGADIHRMLGLGAAAVQMGTRFVATHECDADSAFKQAYVDSRPEDLVVIESPVGLPGRAIVSPFIEAVLAGRKKPFRCPYHCIKSCKGQQSPYCIAMALANARRGRLTNGFAFAGANAHRITEIISVKQLMQTLREEFARAAARPA
jgi:nitronate monooxygenase